MFETPDQAAITALEERAAAREAAVKRLEQIRAGESSGLVREALNEGIKALLIQQTEFLLMAERLRRGV